MIKVNVLIKENVDNDLRNYNVELENTGDTVIEAQWIMYSDDANNSYLSDEGPEIIYTDVNEDKAYDFLNKHYNSYSEVLELTRKEALEIISINMLLDNNDFDLENVDDDFLENLINGGK